MSIAASIAIGVGAALIVIVLSRTVFKPDPVRRLNYNTNASFDFSVYNGSGERIGNLTGDINGGTCIYDREQILLHVRDYLQHPAWTAAGKLEYRDFHIIEATSKPSGDIHLTGIVDVLQEEETPW